MILFTVSFAHIIKKLATHNINIAVVGNPNSGKSSLFNALTGLNQKVGNFPGVTVDKKTGQCELEPGISATIVDLPGTYSLYPRRGDEWVAYKVLMKADADINADLVLLIVDASNLKRNLLFCSQIIDLKYPVVVALTMTDLARKKGVEIDVNGIALELGVPVIPVNPRKNKGISALKKMLSQTSKQLQQNQQRDFISNYALSPVAIDQIKNIVSGLSDYGAIHYLINHDNLLLSNSLQKNIEEIKIKTNFKSTQTQAQEILQRYERIKQIMQKNVVVPDPLQQKLLTEKIDSVLLHRTWGYIILMAVLFFLFQSVFSLAQYPMNGIDWAFSKISGMLSHSLPQAWWSDLIINGLVAGMNGILVFVPQIMILFGLITLLEDSGYMARISFLSDKLMRKAGLNGKSVMPMISGFACAVPAIMSARNIENKKERLLTILITPLMSCSARLPVYTILIALVVPNKFYFGIISLQGLVMMSMYVLGTATALIVSYILKLLIKINEKSYFILELPVYRAPRWKNAGVTMIEKAKIFVKDAGKVIMLISLLLWFLSSYGPSERMANLDKKYEQLRSTTISGNTLDFERQYKSEKLQNSYAGILGKGIEPLIKPLGFDWKIGIALITSFAAREVFVGTMATLYSVEDQNNNTLKEKMQNAIREDGTKVYTLPTALSLMVFYVFAMQCMSTLAVVKRETKTWKWPILQLIYMTALAYLMSFIIFRIF